MSYFICDIAEFGRKVKVTKAKPSYMLGEDIKAYVRDPNNYTRTSNKLGVRSDGNLVIVDSGITNDNNKLRYIDNFKNPSKKININDPIMSSIYREEYTLHNGKKIGKRAYNVVENKKTGKVHEIRRKKYINPKRIKPKPVPLINKYTLGGAAVLGTGALGYAGYKILKNKDKNK